MKVPTLAQLELRDLIMLMWLVGAHLHVFMNITAKAEEMVMLQRRQVTYFSVHLLVICTSGRGRTLERMPKMG